MFRDCNYAYSTCWIFGTVRRDRESHSDEVAPSFCIHKSLTNETNLSVNGLCHGYLHNRYAVIIPSLDGTRFEKVRSCVRDL